MDLRLPDIRKGYLLVAALFISERLTAWFVDGPITADVLVKSKLVWAPIALAVASVGYYIYCLVRLRAEFARVAVGPVTPANWPAAFSSFVNARLPAARLTPTFIIAVFALGLLAGFLLDAAFGLLVLFVQLGYLFTRLRQAVLRAGAEIAE